MALSRQYWLASTGELWQRYGEVSLSAVSFVAFTPGTVKPIGVLDGGVRNVGPRLTNLTVYNGDIALTDGQVVQGLDIYGKITTSGAITVTPIVRDCIIRGPNKPTSQSSSARGSSGDFKGTLFEWCRFDATGRESPWTSTIEGGNYTMRYCEVLRSVDGIGANSFGYATVEACRIYHGFYWSFWDDTAGAVRTTSFTDLGGTTWSPPFISQSSGDTHPDGVQIQGWDNWVLRGNYIGGIRGSTSSNLSQLDPTVSNDWSIIQALDGDAGYKNAGIMVNGSATHPVGALIEYNWLAGGATRINLATSGSDTLSNVTVQHNKFIRMDTYPASYAIVGSGTAAATLLDNVFEDDNSPVPIGFSPA